jgi:hypothetical protein
MHEKEKENINNSEDFSRENNKANIEFYAI